jgi:putative zinc finger protein
MRCEEAQELITAHVDSELTADERSVIESHLETCAECRVVVEHESWLKQQTGLASRTIVAPLALRQAIALKTTADGTTLAVRFRGWFQFLTWRPMFAVTLGLAIAASVIYSRWPAPNLGMAALQTHASILAGKQVLIRGEIPSELRRELSRAVGDRFQPVALDLSMMKLYPVSGFVQKIAGRNVLVTVYQGAGPAVTCFTFLGSEADAPNSAERFYDADMQVNFYSFSRDNVNAILHREGDVICVLVSKMAPADLLALLRGKSAHA